MPNKKHRCLNSSFYNDDKVEQNRNTRKSFNLITLEGKERMCKSERICLIGVFGTDVLELEMISYHICGQEKGGRIQDENMKRNREIQN